MANVCNSVKGSNLKGQIIEIWKLTVHQQLQMTAVRVRTIEVEQTTDQIMSGVNLYYMWQDSQERYLRIYKLVNSTFPELYKATSIDDLGK